MGGQADQSRRAVRYCGCHHPAAGKTRQRVQQNSGQMPMLPCTPDEPRLQGYDASGNVRLNCQDSDTGKWSIHHLSPDEPKPLGRG